MPWRGPASIWSWSGEGAGDPVYQEHFPGPAERAAGAVDGALRPGDESRTTEGSGLGLSIARSLTELQGGTFELAVDGDLFKATVTMPQSG